MKRTRQEDLPRWLGSRSPEQRTGEEVLKFADECRTEGLRLDTSLSNHYQLIMDVVRWSLTRSNYS
ncbi:TPA: hypothetical protein MBD98_004494 [Klebsiella aerogenes]|uniref:hypothetical protein n=1 Tax=Klebsiella aerogenes TaxID=548 RepID=UPI002449AA5B|nr:hypothetical protein [Klebsiella aerogenes]MDH1612225.1 hypothetical protein [Klebsiella aerogenes]HBT2490114.1 hypothetical protein [Klebsiella aerogenes]HBT2500629.1 hypothetical protein [Klebsiella aerogenes]